MNENKKSPQVAATTSEENTQKITEIEKILKSISNDRNELKIILGQGRYEKVVNEIREVLVRNDLNEYTSYQLISHLSDIFRVERIRV